MKFSLVTFTVSIFHCKFQFGDFPSSEYEPQAKLFTFSGCYSNWSPTVYQTQQLLMIPVALASLSKFRAKETVIHSYQCLKLKKSFLKNITLSHCILKAKANTRAQTKNHVKAMTSRNRILTSGLKQLSVVAAHVATANRIVAEVSGGQKQNTINDKSFHMGAGHEITGAW